MGESEGEVLQRLLTAAQTACDQYLAAEIRGTGDIELDKRTECKRSLEKHRAFLSQRLLPMLMALQQNRHIWYRPVYWHPLSFLLRKYQEDRDALDRHFPFAERKTASYPVKDALNALANFAHGLVNGLPPARDVFQVCFRPSKENDDGSTGKTALTCTELKACTLCDSMFASRETQHSDIPEAVIKGATIRLVVSKLRTEKELHGLRLKTSSTDHESRSQAEIAFLEASLRSDGDSQTAVVYSDDGEVHMLDELTELPHDLLAAGNSEAVRDQFAEAYQWCTSQLARLSDVRTNCTGRRIGNSVLPERLDCAMEWLDDLSTLDIE